MSGHPSSVGVWAAEGLRLYFRPAQLALSGMSQAARLVAQDRRGTIWRHRGAPVVLLVLTLATLQQWWLLRHADVALSRVSGESLLLIASSHALAALFSREATARPLMWVLGALIAAPTPETVLAIAGAEAVAQVLQRRAAIKIVFHTGLAALAFGLALSAYTFSSRRLDMGSTGLHGLPGWLPWSGTVLATAVTAYFTWNAAVALVLRVTSSGGASGASSSTGLRGRVSVTLGLFLLQALFAGFIGWHTAMAGVTGVLGLCGVGTVVAYLSRELSRSNAAAEELLDYMVASVEARDAFTAGHSKRVARIVAILARSMGLEPEAAEKIRVAGLLHDVGLAGEEYAPIMAKVGRFTVDEWNTMKRHPLRSAELVSLVPSLRGIVAAVRHHHENWDGTGYPAGLKGTAIPLGARLLMVADTIDAITTERPYRKALPLSECRHELIKYRGRQFDPEIVDRLQSDSVWAEVEAAILLSAVPPPPDPLTEGIIDLTLWRHARVNADYPRADRRAWP